MKNDISQVLLTLAFMETFPGLTRFILLLWQLFFLAVMVLLPLGFIACL